MIGVGRMIPDLEVEAFWTIPLYLNRNVAFFINHLFFNYFIEVNKISN